VEVWAAWNESSRVVVVQPSSLEEVDLNRKKNVTGVFGMVGKITH